MKSEKVLEEALEKVGVPVEYYQYFGTETEYIVYNEEAEELTNHGDNKPHNRIIWWQVHIFAQKESEFRSIKKKTEESITDAGFYITDIVTLYEKETRTIHVVISCNMGETEE